MKILFILTTTTMSNGSIKAIYYLILGLRAKGVEAFVVCPNRNGVYEKLKSLGIPVWDIPTRNNVYPPIKSLYDIFMFCIRLIYYAYINRIAFNRITEICLQFKPDIIHSNGSLCNVGEKVAEKLKITHIYHIREYQDLDFGYHIMPTKKHFIRSFSKPKKWAICITKGVRNHFHLDDLNSTVVYDGVKHNSEVQPIKAKHNYFLFVGRLTEGKGISSAIRAFGKFHETYKNYELWIAGMALDAGYDSYLKNLCIELAIQDSVKFLGVRDDVDKLMQNAKAVVMASQFEGFGLVTAEAMYNGTLVIGKNTGGTKEQIENGLDLTGNKIALSFLNEKELVQCMNDAVNMDIEKYNQIIESGQKTVSNLYSIEQNIDRIYSFYKRILCAK